MPNLTQLGSNLFLGSGLYGVVVHTDQDGQTWVAHHTDKTRQYRTDWAAEKVAEAIDGTRTAQDHINTAHSNGVKAGKTQAKFEHNKLPWWKRMRKKE